MPQLERCKHGLRSNLPIRTSTAPGVYRGVRSVSKGPWGNICGCCGGNERRGEVNVWAPAVALTASLARWVPLPGRSIPEPPSRCSENLARRLARITCNRFVGETEAHRGSSEPSTCQGATSTARVSPSSLAHLSSSADTVGSEIMPVQAGGFLHAPKGCPIRRRRGRGPRSRGQGPGARRRLILERRRTRFFSRAPRCWTCRSNAAALVEPELALVV